MDVQYFRLRFEQRSSCIARLIRHCAKKEHKNHSPLKHAQRCDDDDDDV